MSGHIVPDFLSVFIQGSDTTQMPSDISTVVQRANADRRRLKAGLSAICFKFSEDSFVAHSYALLGNFPFTSMGNFPFEFGEP